MTITIRLKTDNAAFEENRREEVRRILMEWARCETHGGHLYDSNGNKVGSVTVTGK